MSLSTFGKEDDDGKEKQLPYDFVAHNIVRPAEALLRSGHNFPSSSENDTE